jgi:hypothetical protein
MAEGSTIVMGISPIPVLDTTQRASKAALAAIMDRVLALGSTDLTFDIDAVTFDSLTCCHTKTP